MILTVTFGPSSSPNFRRALDYARRVAEAEEIEPGRWRARIELETEQPQTFARAARLLEHVQGWRTSDVELDSEPELFWAVRAMAWCANGYLRSFGRCTFTYWSEVPARCHRCPLFDPERAERELSAERAASPMLVIAPTVPDHVPEGWAEP